MASAPSRKPSPTRFNVVNVILDNSLLLLAGTALGVVASIGFTVSPFFATAAFPEAAPPPKRRWERS